MGVLRENSIGPPALGTEPATVGVVESPYGEGRPAAVGRARAGDALLTSGGVSGGTGTAAGGG